ncbi:DUF6526 family protein [Cytophaga hutchinsonii]|uniref:Uncharacterized protein n=1 Tax=Cytophaga hutchinsonii (strain ATCC 33406 / DSM 1761 / CIP 103989 / NBRC 15051 / NCIMB 9469 / D465) TaxID=269798 RepID=A0A6N4STJ0_CYTH3|nr:DUF6526 family protein [Cytophaga hutchinsonii]ABG59755.1 hypothetical protein CHU_2501 [Cytophaga hutchinsonii ATCC 33406]SFX64753.1 hypothetical protein SAMN04487930_10729 [Cytophaga hutchinsonii ATCC 33406]
METQNYSNHIRYYTPHHFVFYPVVLTCTAVCIYLMFAQQGQVLIWLAFTGLFLLLAALSFMMRQHYALNNQNRIVRLEVYYRYFASTGKRLDTLIEPLSFGQLAALRFASDEEFVALTERTISEKLSPDHIKKSIKYWKPDYMRA